MNKKYSFSWDIHRKCNYRCPYCWFHGKWQDIEQINRYPGIETLVRVWRRIYELYGSVHLELLGGEPMTYPGIDEFIRQVLEFHTLGITTNLSQDMGLIEGLPEKLRSRLRLYASFHPLFADLDVFIEKVASLREHGYNCNINFLAWPGQLAAFPAFKKAVEERRMHYGILTFWGEYNGKQYPAAYSDTERALIDPSVGKRGGESYQTTPVITQGKLCNAGHTYGVIQPDGRVIRCGGGGFGGKEEEVGNIFDPDFLLFDQPRPCLVEHCPCNEWAELLVEKNDR